MDRSRFIVLDSWRGIAAVAVAIYHFGLNSHIFDWSLIKNASLFVDFFFVLSGFVLSYAYAEALRSGMKFSSYLIRRIGRLWPLHVAVMLVLVGLEFYNSWLISQEMMSPRTFFSAEFGRDWSLFLQNLFLVQSLGFEHRIGWNGPAWSISAELWVCLAFGLLATVLSKARLALASAIVFAGAMAVIWLWSPTYMGTNIVFAVPKAAAGFFLGHLVYRSRDFYRRTALPWATGLEIGAVLLMAGFLSTVTVENADPATMLAPLVFAAVVWVFSFEGGLISRLLSAKPFVWVGALSYSIYMVHDTVSLQLGSFVRGCIADKGIKGCGHFIYIDQGFQESRWFADLVGMGYLILVIVISAATYVAIERPSRDLFNRWARAWSDRCHCDGGAAVSNPGAAVLARSANKAPRNHR